MQYRVCEARSAPKLAAEVNRLIGEGWQPLGGVAVAQSQGTAWWWFYQAMISTAKRPESADDWGLPE